MTKLLSSDLDENMVSALSDQKYSPSTPIQGVRIVELKNFITEDGYFMELGRLLNGLVDSFKNEKFELRQMNLSKSAPGTVKAWHLHFDQDDVWFVLPESKLLVGLVDIRKNSSTKDATMRVVMGDGKAQLLYIPRGVAHGYTNLLRKDSFIIYFVNNQFSTENSDEHRLPWDHFGKDFWEVKKG